MKPTLHALFVLFVIFGQCRDVKSQTNYFLSNPIAEEILLGNYNPADYAAQMPIDKSEDVISGLVERVSADELLNSLEFLDTFYNRNTGSDTTSLDTGIGACREWILANFNLISRENENRLVTGFLEFDANVCGKTHHKNPFAILPGRDTSKSEILLIEGHFDTRNEDGCDTNGYTPGSDDNGSGTVLVMEVARVMARYSFDRTIIFTTPTGEDQGLWGAKAWAEYLASKNIEVMACLNNDVVGGIYCGKTSSPPSCPYYGHVDSTHVRVFSYSPGRNLLSNSPHKQLARLIKVVQEETINPLISTPMTIEIMTAEDRTGRSGDHIPFRQKGFPAIRFCSANEHGNGGGTYPDRQHSTRDVLGVDVDEDGDLDTLFVNPNYLARNTLINAAVLANLANSGSNQTFTFTPVESGVRIQNPDLDGEISGFRVGIRYKSNRSNDFDEIYMIDASSDFEIKVEPGSRCLISVAPVYNGYFGLFSDEYDLNLMSSDPLEMASSVRIDAIFPNPADDKIKFQINNGGLLTQGLNIQICDMSGKILLNQGVEAQFGKSLIELNINSLSSGIYMARLSNNQTRSRPQQFIVFP